MLSLTGVRLILGCTGLGFRTNRNNSTATATAATPTHIFRNPYELWNWAKLRCSALSSVIPAMATQSLSYSLHRCVRILFKRSRCVSRSVSLITEGKLPENQRSRGDPKTRCGRETPRD